jgi:SAM-dependent methyltransferase
MKRRLAALARSVPITKGLVTRLAAWTNASAELKRERDQLYRVYEMVNRRHFGNVPLPNEALRMRVGARATRANFLAQGANSSERVIATFGIEPDGPVLDWGCGSGRTWRWLQIFPAWRAVYHGCDVDREAVQWLNDRGVSTARVCDDQPPLPWPDGFFKDVFAFSVLTHIPPLRHRVWYEEIRRVLQPGGRALLTTHGRDVVASIPPSAEVHRSFEENGHAYVVHEGHYKDASLVSEAFTRTALTGLFDLISYQTSGYQNMDIFLVERPRD